MNKADLLYRFDLLNQRFPGLAFDKDFRDIKEICLNATEYSVIFNENFDLSVKVESLEDQLHDIKKKLKDHESREHC